MSQQDVYPQSDAALSVKRNGRRRKKLLVFATLALFTLALAVVWAIYDIGWFIGPWGKVAFIALTWFGLAIALYKLFFAERN